MASRRPARPKRVRRAQPGTVAGLRVQTRLGNRDELLRFVSFMFGVARCLPRPARARVVAWTKRAAKRMVRPQIRVAGGNWRWL